MVQTFNSLVSWSDYKLREVLGREVAKDIQQLVDYLYTSGGYDTQSSLVKTLLRFAQRSRGLISAWSRVSSACRIRALCRVKAVKEKCIR